MAIDRPDLSGPIRESYEAAKGAARVLFGEKDIRDVSHESLIPLGPNRYARLQEAKGIARIFYQANGMKLPPSEVARHLSYGLNQLCYWKGVKPSNGAEMGRHASIAFADMVLRETPENTKYALEVLKESGVLDLRFEAPSTAGILELWASSDSHVRSALKEFGFLFEPPYVEDSKPRWKDRKAMS